MMRFYIENLEDIIGELKNELRTKDCTIEQLEYRINNQKDVIKEKDKKIKELEDMVEVGGKNNGLLFKGLEEKVNKIHELSTKLAEVAVENGKLKSELEEANKQIFRLEDELGCIKEGLKQLSDTYCGDEEVEEITQGDTHTPYPYESGRDYFTAWFGDDR